MCSTKKDSIRGCGDNPLVITVREVLPDDELERLRAKNEQLQQKLERTKGHWERQRNESKQIYNEIFERLYNDLEKLGKAAAGLREALEYYDNEQSWYKLPLKEKRNEAHSISHMRFRAREALAKFDEMMGGEELK